jgi:hypothetical protein
VKEELLEVRIVVSAAYDNLVAIIIVGVIFIGTVVAMPFSTLGTVDQQQLRNVALNVFDAMLLDVGSPSNWGSILSDGPKGSKYFDPNTVAKFGLAYSDPFSKFVLDTDKVQRLNEYELGYEKIRELLGIQGLYGFSLTLYRPFKVTHSLAITENSIQFSVTVIRMEDGTPIPNADVKVTTFLTAVSTKNITDYIYQPIEPYSNTTDIAGNCKGSLSPALGDFDIKSAVAIMEITVAGMSTTVIARNQSSLTEYVQMSTYGDTVILSIRNESLTWDDPGANRKLLDIAAYDSKTLFDIPLPTKEHINWGGTNATFYFPGIRALNPTALLMVLLVNLRNTGDPGSGGPTPILVAGPFGLAGSEKIFEVGGDYSSENPIAVMRRLVVISDMTYVATISFWRE